MPSFETSNHFVVIPAKAGIHSRRLKNLWMPVFTGMTANLDSNDIKYRFKTFLKLLAL